MTFVLNVFRQPRNSGKIAKNHFLVVEFSPLQKLRKIHEILTKYADILFKQKNCRFMKYKVCGMFTV